MNAHRWAGLVSAWAEVTWAALPEPNLVPAISSWNLHRFFKASSKSPNIYTGLSNSEAAFFLPIIKG